MAEAAQKVTSLPSKQMQVDHNEGIISGKIKFTRKDKIKSTGEMVHYTVISTKAPDEFSHPGTVEVSSNDSLGRRDELITVKVQLTGYSRTWDKQSGPNPDDTEQVQTATNYFRVIEQL